VQFGTNQYSINEDTVGVTINVIRSGSTAGTVTVDYAASDGTAIQRTDYEFAAGRLTFNPGETVKTFIVLVNEDNYVEGKETLTLTLSNATGGASLGTPSAANLEIRDDDTTTPTVNPMEDADAFVRMHYHDFLNRDPEPEGEAFWTNEINKCGNSASCRRDRRVAVSAAFFISQEFQQRGYYLYRLYKAGLGRRVAYLEFMADRTRIEASSDLETGKQNFALEFVQRPEFVNKYQSANNANSFVDALLSTVQAASGIDLSSRRGELIAEYNAGSNQTDSRVRTLRKLIEYAEYVNAEYNRAFVLAEYFGYLRREPDEQGYQFWLNVLNNGDPGNYTGMVCSFITSKEYQERFSSVSPRSNQECQFVPKGQ
jgi:hypothetical protein